MIVLETADDGILHISLNSFDLIRLQTGMAYAITNIENHVRDNPTISPARKNFWSNELRQVEADYRRLNAILDEYNGDL